MTIEWTFQAKGDPENEMYYNHYCTILCLHVAETGWGETKENFIVFLNSILALKLTYSNYKLFK